MTQLERIKEIERIFGFELKKVDFNELTFKKYRRSYSVDNGGNIVGLSLDESPVWLLTENENLSHFVNLNFLSLKSVGLENYNPLKELKGLTSLKELKGLTSLNLSDNRLIDVSFLKELKGLTSLDLRDNKIIDVSLLKELKGLTSLYLSNNILTNVSFLRELKGLTSLNLSLNQPTDVSFFQELKGLTSLDIRFHQVIGVSFFKELKGLTSLNLSDNRLIGVSFLKELKALTSLDLTNINLTDVSSLKELKGLTSLNLSDNRIADFSFLKELKGLISLDLRNTELTDFSFLKELKGLTSLDLRNTKLTDVSFLKELKGLTSLDLSWNQLTDASFLKELKGLNSLDLRNTKLTDVSSLEELKELTSLNLSYNPLTDVSFLKELKGLTSLELGNTELTDVSFLKELKGLTSINLSSNRIRKIPDWLAEKNLEIRIDSEYERGCINLFGNKIEEPPLQIVKQGNKAILEYYRQAAKYDHEKAYEAKVMIIGEPNAGKTTFMKLLFDKNYPVPEPSEPSTLGIEIRFNRIFKNPHKDSPDMKANVWDFGGQNIQYMLHHYFMSDDSVYVLVTDGRSGNTRYGYWFHIINLLGKRSPVLVLLNKHKLHSSVIPFNSKACKDTFTELIITDLGEIDFSQLDHKWDFIINEIASKLSGLEIMGKEILKPWKAIREKISELNKKYISLEEFSEICQHNGLKEPDEAYFLLDYFHAIGFALNFKEDSLENTVFLDPNWITHSIYDALKSDEKIFEKTGIFHRDKLFQHWQSKECDEIHKQVLTKPECIYLLNLMLKDKFDICYKLEGRQNYYVVPRKLSEVKPEYEWNSQDNLHFRFQYPFMPEGLISTLTVRMYEYIDGKKVWLSGVILKDDEATAEVTQSETTSEGLKYIGIRVMGKNLDKRQRLLRKIRGEIERIHKKTFPYIDFSEMVVCNCKECAKRNDPNFYGFNKLKIHLRNNKREIFCEIGEVDVNIQRMLDDVYTHEDFDERGNKLPVESIEKSKKRRPLSVFISYSQKDKKHLTNLNKHLSSLVQTGKLKKWDDTDLLPAENWDEKIHEKLNKADIVILLVSHNFMSTKYIMSKEVPIALKNEKANGAAVVPVILDFCKWEILEFAENNALPEKAHPITDKNKWDNQNQAWLNVVDGLETLVDEINRRR